jgi:hypothetical protein
LRIETSGEPQQLPILVPSCPRLRNRRGFLKP